MWGQARVQNYILTLGSQSPMAKVETPAPVKSAGVKQSTTQETKVSLPYYIIYSQEYIVN